MINESTFEIQGENGFGSPRQTVYFEDDGRVLYAGSPILRENAYNDYIIDLKRKFKEDTK